MPYAFSVASGSLTTKSKQEIERLESSNPNVYSYHIQENEVKLTYTNNSDGTIDWKITINKSYSQQYTDDTYKTKLGNAVQPAVYLYLKIGSTEVINKRYSYGWNTSNHEWGEFPNKAGTSVSGTVDVADGTSGNISIVLESWVYYTNNPADYSSAYPEKASTSVTKTCWTNIGKGDAIVVVDQKNCKVRITIPNFTNGTNNTVKSKTASIQFKNGSTNIGSIASSDIIWGTATDYDIPPNANKVFVTASATGTRGDTASKSTDSSGVSVTYRTKPSVSNLVLSWESAHKKDNTARLKDDLTWNWSGVVAGINTPIEGYRIFVYKTTTGNLTSGESKYSYDADGKLIIDSSKSGTSLPLKDSPSSISHIGGGKDDITAGLTDYNTNYLDITTDKTAGYFSFNPKDAGFENKDYCVFEIGAKYSWGGKTAFSTWETSEPNKQNCNCYFKNSANVWVKVADSKTLTGTEKLKNDWKEAESIWVKTSSGWKEAEGLWVKTDTNTWSESS